MQKPDTEANDRVDLAVGTAGSLIVNLGYLLLFHGDQRMILMLCATVLAGMVLLLARGALGMGVLIGAGLAIMAALAVVAIGPHSIVKDDGPSRPPVTSTR